jgi:hypothetical protein
MLWRLITATSLAKLVPPPPPHGITAHACGGHLSHTCLCSNRQPANLKYMYSTLLLLSLFGRYHVCLPHNGDSTITRSLQQLPKQCTYRFRRQITTSADRACRRRHLCLPTRLLRRLAPGAFLRHRCNVRRQQDHPPLFPPWYRWHTLPAHRRTLR